MHGGCGGGSAASTSRRRLLRITNYSDNQNSQRRHLAGCCTRILPAPSLGWGAPAPAAGTAALVRVASRYSVIVNRNVDSKGRIGFVPNIPNILLGQLCHETLLHPSFLIFFLIWPPRQVSGPILSVTDDDEKFETNETNGTGFSRPFRLIAEGLRRPAEKLVRPVVPRNW
jgi:hypothetical protein